MNITYWLLLISFIIAMIALYFDLRKVKSTDLSIVNNNQFNKFFAELMEYERLGKLDNTFGFSKSKPVYRTLSDSEVKSIEKRFLNDIQESKKYKVKYEVDKTKPYNIFKVYERYSKVEIKSKTKQPLLLEYKQQNKIEIGEIENVEVNR